MCGLDVLKLDIDDLCDAESVAGLVENDCKFKFYEDEGEFCFTLYSPDGEDSWDFDASIEELGYYIVTLEIIAAEEYDPETGEVSE